MLRQARDLPRAIGELREEGEPIDETVGHAVREAWWRQLEEARRDHHARIDRIAARVVAHEDHSPARGNVLDAVAAHGEVVTIQPAERLHAQGHGVARDPEAIEPMFVEGELEASDALLDFVTQGS